jgi:hypothetical protein
MTRMDPCDIEIHLEDIMNQLEEFKHNASVNQHYAA